MKACLLIDGHSVIHCWEELRELHRQGKMGRSAARDVLVREVGAHVDAGDEDAILVFDGAGFQGERIDAPENRAGFRVLYSRSGETADDVIERLARRFAREYQFRVVTADQLEANVVVSEGAFWVSPEQFRKEVERGQLQMSARIRRRRAVRPTENSLGARFFAAQEEGAE